MSSCLSLRSLGPAHETHPFLWKRTYSVPQLQKKCSTNVHWSPPSPRSPRGSAEPPLSPGLPRSTSYLRLQDRVPTQRPRMVSGEREADLLTDITRVYDFRIHTCACEPILHAAGYIEHVYHVGGRDAVCRGCRARREDPGSEQD